MAKARTIESLRLDVESASKGKTWLLLPEGFRDAPAGKTYLLPTQREDLQRVSVIAIGNRRDSGSAYVRRCMHECRKRKGRAWDNKISLAKRDQKIDDDTKKFNRKMELLHRKGRRELHRVEEASRKAVASLNTIFEKGKGILNKQMDAYNNDEELFGEKISHSAARDCVGRARQLAKDFGLPTDPKDDLSDAAMDELASALEETQSVVAMAPGASDEVDN